MNVIVHNDFLKNVILLMIYSYLESFLVLLPFSRLLLSYSKSHYFIVITSYSASLDKILFTICCSCSCKFVSNVSFTYLRLLSRCSYLFLNNGQRINFALTFSFLQHLLGLFDIDKTEVISWVWCTNIILIQLLYGAISTWGHPVYLSNNFHFLILMWLSLSTLEIGVIRATIIKVDCFIVSRIVIFSILCGEIWKYESVMWSIEPIIWSAFLTVIVGAVARIVRVWLLDIVLLSFIPYYLGWSLRQNAL